MVVGHRSPPAEVAYLAAWVSRAVAQAGMRDIPDNAGHIDQGIALEHAQAEIIEIRELHDGAP